MQWTFLLSDLTSQVDSDTHGVLGWTELVGFLVGLPPTVWIGIGPICLAVVLMFGLMALDCVLVLSIPIATTVVIIAAWEDRLKALP